MRQLLIYVYLHPMETIPKPDCQKIGFIRKTHGVHGELVLEYEPEFEESVAEASRFFLEIDGFLVPFFVAEDGLRSRSAKTALVTFDWVDTEKYARRLVGSPVYLFNFEIIDEPGDGTTSQFLHFRLLDENGKEVGKISAVDDYTGNIVFTVNGAGGEILVPFNEDFLLKLNEKQKTIQLRLPEGLMK
jgi:16S rRNA processing protein RimM